jgi:predicted Zn-dependent protease
VGYLYARSGKRAEALHLLAQLQQRHPTPWDKIAEVYAGLGDTAQALGALETAYETRDLSMGDLGEPEWDALRADPRFLQLRKKMGLAR